MGIAHQAAVRFRKSNEQISLAEMPLGCEVKPPNDLRGFPLGRIGFSKRWDEYRRNSTIGGLGWCFSFSNWGICWFHVRFSGVYSSYKSLRCLESSLCPFISLSPGDTIFWWEMVEAHCGRDGAFGRWPFVWNLNVPSIGGWWFRDRHISEAQEPGTFIGGWNIGPRLE